MHPFLCQINISMLCLMPAQLTPRFPVQSKLQVALNQYDGERYYKPLASVCYGHLATVI